MHKLVYYPDPILNTVSKPVTEFDQNLKSLAEEMFKIRKEHNGVGLAGVQVGEAIRMFVMETVDGKDVVFCNPVITLKQNPKNINESCLSLPGIFELNKRYLNISVKYQDLNGEEKEEYYFGLQACCVQHEIDHLDGKLFIEEIPEHKRFFLKGKLQSLRTKYENSRTNQK